MKYGMPTLVECKDIFDCARVARENNLDFIEINKGSGKSIVF